MRLHCCAVVLALSLAAPDAFALAPGQVDDFQAGTTMDWGVPGVTLTPPAVQPTGGPAGASDAYLQILSTGSSGPSSRLSVLNTAQWAGNYLTAGGTGVGAIRMDVNNAGPSELHLRLLFESFPAVVPAPPQHLALSATAVVVPANSGWTTVLFPITPADLLATTGTVAGALADTDTLRLFHNPDPTFAGPGVGPPPVAATLGVDNITAFVPEPIGLVLPAAALTACLRRRQRHAAVG